MLPLRREHTHHYRVCINMNRHTHTDTTPDIQTHAYIRSEWKRQRVCNSHSTVWKMRRLTEWGEVCGHLGGEQKRGKKSPLRKWVLVREFLSLSIIYQCLSLWQLLCQALPVLLSPGFDPSCGSDPSSGLTSLVHQWLVIGGGQRPAGRLSAFLSTKTKLSLKKKEERHASSIILFF